MSAVNVITFSLSLRSGFEVAVCQLLQQLLSPIAATGTLHTSFISSHQCLSALKCRISQKSHHRSRIPVLSAGLPQFPTFMCFQATEKLQLMYVTHQGCFSSHANEQSCGYLGVTVTQVKPQVSPKHRMHQQHSFKSLQWKADASQILVLDNSNIFTNILFSQILVSPRWPVGSPQLMGRSDVVGHRQTLLRVDNSTLGYSWAPRDSTQNGLLYSWTSSDSTQAHWTCFFSWHHFWSEILWTHCPDLANS